MNSSNGNCSSSSSNISIDPSELERYSSELAVAAHTIGDYLRDTASSNGNSISPDAPERVHTARRTMLDIVERVQRMLAEPTWMIQQLSRQTQLLSCVKWLGELQILACIPIEGSVGVQDVADLVGVPGPQLSRIIRMTATAGFLCEPKAGQVAHTVLSAPFVTNLGHLDAALFLAETAAPTSLHMSVATRRNGIKVVDDSSASAYAVFNARTTFEAACAREARLQRQWTAYSRCMGDDVDEAISELLGRLNWRSVGSRCVVDACASSTAAARTLALQHPGLRIIAQTATGDMLTNGNGNSTTTSASNGNGSATVRVEQRLHGGLQTVTDAAVYILRLHLVCHALPARIQAELRAHLGVLSANTSATLILAPRLLPEPGSVAAHVEASARLADLSRHQLMSSRDMELDEITTLVNAVYDIRGGLVVVNKLTAPDGRTLAVAVKYQPYTADFVEL